MAWRIDPWDGAAHVLLSHEHIVAIATAAYEIDRLELGHRAAQVFLFKDLDDGQATR